MSGPSVANEVSLGKEEGSFQKQFLLKSELKTTVSVTSRTVTRPKNRYNLQLLIQISFRNNSFIQNIINQNVKIK